MAKKRFLEDLQKAKDAKAGAGLTPEQISELKHQKADPVVARESGKVLWEIQGDGEVQKAIEPFIGQKYADGDTFCYIENAHGQISEVPANMGGRLVEICAKQGANVSRGDVIAYIDRL